MVWVWKHHFPRFSIHNEALNATFYQTSSLLGFSGCSHAVQHWWTQKKRKEHHNFTRGCVLNTLHDLNCEPVLRQDPGCARCFFEVVYCSGCQHCLSWGMFTMSSKEPWEGIKLILLNFPENVTHGQVVFFWNGIWIMHLLVSALFWSIEVNCSKSQTNVLDWKVSCWHVLHLCILETAI